MPLIAQDALAVMGSWKQEGTGVVARVIGSLAATILPAVHVCVARLRTDDSLRLPISALRNFRVRALPKQPWRQLDFNQSRVSVLRRIPATAEAPSLALAAADAGSSCGPGATGSR